MRYGILGVTQAEDDHGGAIPVGGPRVRALLAALAARAGRVVAAHTLIDEVWADDPPQDAHAALQALVGRLRRAVGKGAVVSEPGGYRLAAGPDDVDLHVFERLVREGTAALDRGDPAAAARDLTDALALWRGPALADLPDRTAATRPETLRLEAVRARIDADLRLGRAQDVVPELTELTQASPYDETLHALLLRALRDIGRRAEALAAYDTARRALVEGLGTDPGPELRALYQELLGEGDGGRPAAVPHLPPSRPEPAGNLRPRLTSFVGRERELDAIRADLRRARLVTLTGPGGSGKTRLAEEAAAGLPQAWLVELASLDRPEAVPVAVVNALGLRKTTLMTHDLVTPQDDPVALLVEHCATRSRLLILDNCEHVIGAVADLAETLLTRCPGLTILATSREPLGVPGESVRPVDPLSPDQARRLFAERAAAVRPDADALLRDEEAVAEICRRLDGLPLAIELAAARLRLLTPRQIADRLDDRFRLLTSGSRTVLPRQQTLRAVVDWSWDLLDEGERTVLRELSVFAGGWDLAAAEAVCGGPVAGLLGALVDKSLVVADPSAGQGTEGMRYRLLETIHEYAAERAAEAPGRRAAAERRHRAWVRSLVEEADPRLRSAGQLPWISRLETELDNIRAALDRALTAGDEADAAAIALAMGWFWWLRNYRHEGARWINRVLRLSAPPGTPGDADADAFVEAPPDDERHPLYSLRRDLRMFHLFLTSETEPRDLTTDPRYARHVARLRAAYERGGPHAARMPGIVWPLTVFQRLGADVRPVLDAAVANCRAYGGDWELGVALMLRTHIVVDSSGGLSGVDEDLAELRVLSRRVGDRWMRAQVCSASGEAAMARGRFTEAREEYGEALRLAHEVGAYAETPFLVARLAEIAYRSGDRRAAEAALTEAEEAADRYWVADARAFVSLLRAYMALEDRDIVRARQLCRTIGERIARGTPPPQFVAALRLLDAMVTAVEEGPERALPKMARALRRAVAEHCAETVTGSIVDEAANVLGRLGDFPRTARLLAAGERLRGGLPRPRPEGARTRRTEAAARAALGAERYAAECARGAALTLEEIAGELDEAAATRPARTPTSR
ncbi:BTAD domain-containing putative transcriptional regulator [Streptomyces sp. JB150]|uniref:ATP-binding protein n=1 Tax=Streptomyces sp. JB150 TaxID=2714844 RepID=UPI00140BE9FC|nr:BTAD domain-containing putative transcriptional regulator [Streptomyces sp. JB150]QIJ63478.1 AfsR/SARP family transcriptional regulator [Streptomyces sp. JB150]